MQNTKTSFSENENVSKAASVVGIFTLFSRILGLFRDIVLANVFGIRLTMDAFVVAFTIPNIFRRLFVEGSLTLSFIPIFIEYLRQKSKADAFELARTMLTILSIIMVIGAILGVLFAPWIVRILAFGFGGVGEKYELTVLLTRITFPYIFLISMVALFMGILNSLRHFAGPAAAPIFLNVGIIGATLWISPYLSQPIVGTAMGVIIGGVIQVLMQVPVMLKKGFSFIPLWMPRHPAIKRIGLLMLPAVFSSAIFQFNIIVNRFLACFLEEGSISSLYLADRIVQFPLGIFTIALSTAALPSLSKQIAAKDFKGFADTLNHALGLTLFVIIPSMVGLIILRKPIIQLLFERMAFDASSTIMTAKALLFYTMGLWAVSGAKVLVPAFYALQDTKTPVKVGVIALAVNFICALFLMGPLQHGGLALAPSIASAVNICFLVFFLKRNITTWNPMSVYHSSMKSMIASGIMGFILYFVSFYWSAPDIESGIMSMAFYVFGMVFMGMIAYFFVARLLGCKELASILVLFKGLLSVHP